MAGLAYNNQIITPLIGSKDSANTITSIALTSAYQAESTMTPTKTFEVGDLSRVEFLVRYSMGATETANTIQLIIEASNDRSNFFQLATDSTTTGVSTLTQREWTLVGTDAGNADFNYGIDTAYKIIRISAKETGVVTNAGSVFVEALLSGW